MEDEVPRRVVALAAEQRRLVKAVEMKFVVAAAIARPLCQLCNGVRLTCGGGQRRKEIGHVGNFAADPPAGRAGPANERRRRHTHAALPCRALVATEWRGPAFGPHILVCAVVGRVDHDCILAQTQLVQLVEELPDMAVMLLEAVAINVFPTGARLALRALLEMKE